MQVPNHVPLATTTRGGHAELVHVGSIAVVDSAGKLIAGIGDPESLNFTRSSLKPLQALALVEGGGVERFGCASQQLAVLGASHHGAAIHVATAARTLAAIGASEADLQCGCHAPYYFQSSDTKALAGVRWSALCHNCSGKHSGFLALARLCDQPLGSYLDSDAPAQTAVRRAVQRFAPGVALPMGIDGCSAPNYALPLTRLAQAFALLATGSTPELGALAYAMRRHPDLVSGAGRVDLALMQTAPGDWVSKVGADGVQAIGIASQGVGIAIRVADGNARALHAVTVEVLRQLGLLDDPGATPLAPFARPQVKNYRGTVTGRVEMLFKLPAIQH
ncbi:MAG: asparaginase [Betaproteobacteria bacterium]